MLFRSQMEAFRSTKNGPGELIVNNCRPVCPLNNRVVRCSAVAKSSVMRNDGNDQVLQNGDIMNNGGIENEVLDDEEEF